MFDFSERTVCVFGKDNTEKLEKCRVAVFGIGGVGGHAVEALARSGIGHLDLIDSDTVECSNINRQMAALHSTIGREKTEVMKERLLDINPGLQIRTFPILYLPDTADRFDFTEYDYVVDAVDNVTAKIDLVLRAREAGVPIISSMGAGNKIHPEMFEVADLYETSGDPLARVMRRELKKRGIKSLPVVYSKEQPIERKQDEKIKERRPPVGSLAFVPGTAGMIMAGKVIRDLLKY